MDETGDTQKADQRESCRRRFVEISTEFAHKLRPAPQAVNNYNPSLSRDYYEELEYLLFVPKDSAAPRSLKYYGPASSRNYSYPKIQVEDLRFANDILKRKVYRSSGFLRRWKKPKDLLGAYQERFIAATATLSDRRFSIAHPDFIEAVFQLGSWWDSLTDPQVRLDQGKIRINLAIHTQNIERFKMHITYLLPHHVTTILVEHFEECNSDQILILLDFVEEFSIISRVLQSLQQISSGCFKVLRKRSVLNDLMGCKIIFSTDSSSSKSDPTCILCQALVRDQNFNGPLACQIFKAALASSHTLALVKILYHSFNLWSEDTIIKLMLDVFRHEKLEWKEKNDLIEAAICLDRGIFAMSSSADLSDEANVSQSLPTSEQYRLFSGHTKINLDILFQKTLTVPRMQPLEVFKKYSFQVSTSSMEALLDRVHADEWLQILISRGLLSHSVIRFAYTKNYETAKKTRVVQELIFQGNQCICLVDEIYQAALIGNFEMAYKLTQSLYSHHSSSSCDLSSKTRSWEEFSPECFKNSCLIPRYAEELGWSRLGLPPSFNSALTGVLLVYLRKNQQKLSDNNSRLLMQNNIDFDDSLRQCITLLYTRKQYSPTYQLIRNCHRISPDPLYRFLLAKIKEGCLWTQELSIPIFLDISFLPQKQQHENLARLAKLAGADLDAGTSDRLIYLIRDYNHFTTETRQKGFSSVLQAHFDVHKPEMSLRLIKTLRCSKFDDDAVIQPILKYYIETGFQNNPAIIQELFDLLSSKATDWILKLPEDHSLFSEEFLAVVFAKCGRVEIPSIEADEFAESFLNNIDPRINFSRGMVPHIVLQASTTVKQNLLLKISTLMRLYNATCASGCDPNLVSWASKNPLLRDYIGNDAVQSDSPDRRRILNEFGEICRLLACGTDVNLKDIGVYSPFENIVLSDSVLLPTFLKQAGRSGLDKAVSALVCAAIAKPKIQKHVGRCALNLESAFNGWVLSKANLPLAQAVAFDLFDKLWSGHPPCTSSARLTSLILSITSRSKSLISRLWYRTASIGWPDLLEVSHREAFRVFIRWTNIASTRIDVPVFAWALLNNLDFLVELLVDEGVSVRLHEVFPYSALLTAIKLSKPDTVIKSLIRGGASINDGSLHEAARSINLNATTLLLVGRHDPNFESPRFDARTVLAEVCASAKAQFKGDATSLLSLLASRNADPNLVSGDRYSRTENAMQPIFYALDNPSFLIDDFLEVNSANLNARVGDWLHVSGNICRSPISYLESECQKCGNLRTSSAGPEDCHWQTSHDALQARIATLERHGIERRYYALEGPQPPGAVGLPPALQRIEDKKIDRNTLIGKICDICDEPIVNPATAFGFLTDQCEHIWSTITCKDDLEMYLAAKMQVEDGAVSDRIYCWASNCKVILDYQDVKRYANPQDFEAYDAALFQQAVRRGKEFLECATPTCQGGGWIDSNHKITRFICTICRDATCVDCTNLFSRHPKEGCPAAAARKSAQHAAENEASERFMDQRYCLGVCGHRVEKISGCDHIHCTRCNRHFCYECGADFNVIWSRGRNHHKPNCSHWAVS